MEKMNSWKIMALAIVLVVTSTGLLQAGDIPDHKEIKEIKEIIEAVRNGWLQADGEPFRRHFLDHEGARYFESGGQNEGLSDLISHHVEPEADAFEEFSLSFSNIETHIEGDFAWALADTEIRATLKHEGRVIHNRGHETFLFRKMDGQWKVVHTHSSSRAARK